MGAIGPSGFIFRDFIKFILPTAIGASLFAPFLIMKGNTVSFEGLAFIVVLLGYVIYSPIAILSDFFQAKLPFKNLRLDDARKQNEKLINRWDYDALWSALSKDEREYLYLTQSYFEFYQTTGFYFLAYFLINLIRFTYTIVNSWSIISTNWNNLLWQASTIKTPTIVQYDAPTWLAIVLSGLLAYFLFGDATLEYSYLRGSGGAFDRYAQKYHKDVGNIALSIWGKVIYFQNDKSLPLISAKVCLRVSSGETIASAITDSAGTFQFENAFLRCLNSQCVIEIDDEKWKGSASVQFSEKTIPYVEVQAIKK